MKAQNLTPNIRTAIQEFLEIFAVPEVAPENIFYGNQNNLALPPGERLRHLFLYLQRSSWNEC